LNFFSFVKLSKKLSNSYSGPRKNGENLLNFRSVWIDCLLKLFLCGTIVARQKSASTPSGRWPCLGLSRI